HFTFILHFSPSFINNESLSSFSSDLPILLKSLLRVVSFFWSPNSIRTILWLVCRSPRSHAREAGVFTRAKPLYIFYYYFKIFKYHCFVFFVSTFYSFIKYYLMFYN